MTIGPTLLLPALVLLTTLCGCKEDGASKTAPSATPATTTAAATGQGKYGTTSNDGAYYVSYTPSPDPIPLNQMFELRVWVSPAQARGQAIAGATLHVDAAMPEHDHGMNTKPKVTANPDGSFAVRGMLFHMPGRWELYCDITSGGVTERSQFDVELE